MLHRCRVVWAECLASVVISRKSSMSVRAVVLHANEYNEKGKEGCPLSMACQRVIENPVRFCYSVIAVS